MSNVRRKRNLLADRCAIFEANANSDSQSESFLTNLARRRTTKDAVKDDSTQATMDISENSLTTVGSGSFSASARRSALMETMDAIGEDSISDNIYEHLGPPTHITRKRISFLSGMNVSDVTLEPFSPQVSSSNLFQNSLEYIHQPVTEAPAKDKIVISPSKRRSDLIAHRASLFEGCTSPPSGFIISQIKSPERSEKNDPSAPKSFQQMRDGVASLKISERRDFSASLQDKHSIDNTEDSEKSEQHTWRTLDKKDDFQQIDCDVGHSPINVLVKGDEDILHLRRRTPNKEEADSESKASSKALGSKANPEIRQLTTREFRSTIKSDTDSESHNALINVASRKKSVRHDIERSNESDVPSPTTPRRERSTDTGKSLKSTQHTIHNCSPIIQKSESTAASQASSRVKSPEKRKAMLKKLLKVKRSPATNAV
jgi:hypothetical protein